MASEPIPPNEVRAFPFEDTGEFPYKVVTSGGDVFQGHVSVSDAALPSEVKDVTITDSGLEPAKISIRPGLKVTWRNARKDSVVLHL